MRELHGFQEVRGLDRFLTGEEVATGLVGDLAEVEPHEFFELGGDCASLLRVDLFADGEEGLDELDDDLGADVGLGGGHLGVELADCVGEGLAEGMASCGRAGVDEGGTEEGQVGGAVSSEGEGAFDEEVCEVGLFDGERYVQELLPVFVCLFGVLGSEGLGKGVLVGEVVVKGADGGLGVFGDGGHGDGVEA